MKHILSNCHLALSRYTWRHNKVLKVLSEMAKEQVEEGKCTPKPQKHGLIKIEFVLQGGKVPDRKKANETMLHQSGVKWEVVADLKGCERFFPIPTTKKPDLVIWNEDEKEVHLVEITVPHEDNISSAHEQKGNRYEALVRACERQGGKQCISQSKLAAEDSSWQASQSGWEWQDLVQRKRTSWQKLSRRLLRKPVTGYGWRERTPDGVSPDGWQERHTVELARRPHIGEGARCVTKAVDRKSPKQRRILSWWSPCQSPVYGAVNWKLRRKLFWSIYILGSAMLCVPGLRCGFKIVFKGENPIYLFVKIFCCCNICLYLVLYTFQLIRLKLEVVLKEFKLNILMLLLNQGIYGIKGNNCCFADFIKDTKTPNHNRKQSTHTWMLTCIQTFKSGCGSYLICW